MKRKSAAILAVSAAFLLAGCGQTSQPLVVGTTSSAESIARTALEALYSTDAQDSADFEEALAASATGESALDAYLTAKVGDTFTDDGLDNLVANRVVTRALNAWPASEVRVDSIDLQETGTQSDTGARYTYTVTAAPEGEDPETFTGEIGLTFTDGIWQVSSIQ